MSQSPDLFEALRQADHEHQLFNDGDRVLVAVSGGADSMALLDVLHRYSPVKNLELHIAHLDHMIRSEAVDDAAFVQQIASEWGLPAVLDARDVPAFAAREGKGMEEAARLARYAFLARVALKIGADGIVLGHHADDQAETVLMNLIRGSGLDGILGMPFKRDFPIPLSDIARFENLDLSGDRPPSAKPWPPPLIRPLLSAGRRQIEDWNTSREIDHREDPSNRDPAFLRNRLRHEILPLLEIINPRVKDALNRLAGSVGADLRFLDEHTDRAWRAARLPSEDGRAVFSLEAWDALDTAIQRRLLRRAVEGLEISQREFGWEHIEAARRAVNKRSGLGLPGGYQLVCGADRFEIRSARPKLPSLQETAEPIPLKPGQHEVGGWRVQVTRRPRRSADGGRISDRWLAVISAEWLNRDLAIRTRRPGDKIQVLGMGGRHKLIQDLFVDSRTPQSQRSAWPLIAAGEHILWVPGLRLSELAKIGIQTSEVLEIQVLPPDGSSF